MIENIPVSKQKGKCLGSMSDDERAEIVTGQIFREKNSKVDPFLCEI